MIGMLKGKLAHTESNAIIVDVNGVGYRVVVVPSLTQKNIGDDISLFVHTYVREDAFDLYGFERIQELKLFQMVIKVSGIGPKSAISLLSMTRPEMIVEAILREDASVMTKVSGIGKKTAERLIVELKSKLEKESDGTTDPGNQTSSEQGMAIDALVSLGYTVSVSRDAVEQAAKNGHKDVESLIRDALKSLATR